MREESKDIKEYKNAVWSFLIEHCEILDSGTVFVKFHTSNRRDFEKRVFARYHYNYHREDWETKNKNHEIKKEVFKQTKEQKKLQYAQDKRKRRALLRYRDEMIEWSTWYQTELRKGIFARIRAIFLRFTWKKKPKLEKFN